MFLELMQLRTVRDFVRVGLLAVFGLCATDGICQARGLRFLGTALQNVAVVLFFLLSGLALLLARKERDRRAVGRIRLWAGSVLALGVGLLVLLWVALVANFSAFWVNGLIYLLALVTAPVSSCSIMFWPIFGWTLLLVASWKLCRDMDKSKKADSR